MTRSQQTQTFNTAQNLQKQATDQANQTLATGQGIARQVQNGYSNILANPGYDQATKNAITGNSMGALNSAYDAMASKATDAVGKTNNSAGYTSLLDDLARQRGAAASNQAAQNQIAFGNNAEQQRQMALGGLGGLNAQTNSLYGTQTGNARGDLSTQESAAQTPGFWDTMASGFASGLGNGLGGLISPDPAKLSSVTGGWLGRAAPPK